jgi:hypothetical protein
MAVFAALFHPQLGGSEGTLTHPNPPGRISPGVGMVSGSYGIPVGNGVASISSQHRHGSKDSLEDEEEDDITV